MAPLSKELSGVILPHDHYGSHLNSRGQSTDVEKEKQNFQFAAETLAEIWSRMIIDKFPVISEFIKPDESEIAESDLNQKSMEWQNKHVRSSQYLLQIVKCQDPNCCKPFRSDLLKILPERFLPPPVQINQGDNGLIIDSQNGEFSPLFLNLMLQKTLCPEVFKDYKEIPYELMCPSIQGDMKRKICKKCGVYFASLTYLKRHTKYCNKEAPKIKVRPVRVAAKRQRELLAIIKKN